MTLALNEDRLSSRSQGVNSRYGIDTMERGLQTLKRLAPNQAIQINDEK